MREATARQIALITRLAAERDLLTLTSADSETVYTVLAGEPVSARAASAAIDALFTAPRTTTAPAAEPGYYVQGQDVLVVVKNREGTRTYAKRLTLTPTASGASRAAWEYAPGVGRTLAGLEPLTVEQAARLGHQHGVCIVCTKALTDPASVERGIGPVCAKRLAA